MRPTLRSGDHVVVLFDALAPIKVGHIVVVDLGEVRGLALHRVVAAFSGFYLLKGDFNFSLDGWFPRSAILGVVDEFEHGGQRHSATRLRDRMLGLALSGLGLSSQVSRRAIRRLVISVADRVFPHRST